MKTVELFEYDRKFLPKTVAGIDEAGRGPLAGPVVAACVIMPLNEIIDGINDSKKLSENKRERLYALITEKAVAYGVGIADREKIDEIKANDGDNNTEQVAASLGKVPGLFLKFVVWLLNLMDYFGWIPQPLLDASPFHGSMIITDLGSLGIPPIYHHLYNFGNLPVFIAFGAKHRTVELDKTGTPVERKYFDYKVVMDERIIDGMYYATAFKYIKYYLRSPEALEAPPQEIREDIF